ncbi:MAG: aminotransferase class I/II-fold pyridoxal phosphate-dependent enzyme, partial [Clostridia bacterium]
QKVKFLCPVPGYDRHFGICESFGIEMITVPMDSNGPDMDIVETMVANDDSIKGIWCVPKYSNPSGITYSDEVVERLCKMTTLAKDFRVFWDNAYVVHDLYDETDHLLNAFECATKYGNEDRFFIFTSTSKITLPGAGVACMACSESNVKEALAVMKYKTIGPNKVVQLMHYLYLQDIANIHEIMKRQAKIIRPKFEYVLANLESNFINGDIVSWTKPRGGYFISINLLKGCAKAVYGICKEAGLIITEAGATYPLRNDDFDSNLRIAPTFTSQTDLIVACDIMVNSIKIACIEKILKK